MIYATKRELTFLVLFLCLTPFAGFAQFKDPSPDIPEKKDIKIGLALSGGGAKGFAHIGVLKVFEEEGIPVNMVSGTSMGAIVGSLYAIGYTPQQIEDIVLSADWDILFNDSYRINPQNISNSVSSKDTYLLTFPFNGRRLRLPSGLIDGQNISMMLYRLMLPYHDVRDFTKLPIPFSAVATDLSSGQAHTFTQGYLPDAVRASSAIPTIFKPVKIDGQTYIDGGVARNIPAEDVRNLGADFVISSDVGEPVKPVDSLNTFVDILFQSVGFHQQESNKRQIDATDFYMHPDITDFSSFSYDHAKEIIKRGEEAARKMIPQLKAYLANYHLSLPPFDSISPSHEEMLTISEVTFANIKGLLKRQASLGLDIHTPSQLTLHQVERKVNQLYNSGLFSQISYRIEPDSAADGKELILKFQPKEQEYAGFSVRYDSRYKAALLFGASLTDNIFWSDRLTTQLRVGEVLELSSQYSTPVTLAPLSQAHLGLKFQRSPIDFYEQKRALSTIEVERLALAPSVSILLFDLLNMNAGLESEVYSLNEAVGNTLVLENTSFLLKPHFSVGYNTLNQPHFPGRGQAVHALAEWADREWGSKYTFLQLSGNALVVLPLIKDLSLRNDIFAGYTSASDIPLHYYYYLGGLAPNPVFTEHQDTFMGYAAQQLRAKNVIALESQLQFRLTKNTYLSAGWNVAHLSDTWTFNIDSQRLKYGYGLSFGTNTIIGPIELSLSTPEFSGGYALKIDVGYHF